MVNNQGKQKSSFSERVKEVVRAIPEGAVLTYGEVAMRAGNAYAARAVGMVMRNNDDISVPCHRVVRADGTLGGYNGLQGDKRTLLINEGYAFKK